MQWNLMDLFIVAVLMLFCPPMLHAQEAVPPPAHTQILRWKNGDALPGKLLESASDVIRWASPYFSDDLTIAIDVLDSVVFPDESVPATEDFRVGSVSGDIWIADIVDSDADTLLFASDRQGQFRVKREAIHTLERREHPNLIFDGSQLANWGLPKGETKMSPFQFGTDTPVDWYPDGVGHPRTDKVKAKIFHALDWPQRFEIDLELAATTRPPGFVFALGRNLYETLRLETWVNELVVVQGTLFEPVLTIRPDRRDFRLRIAYDTATEVLEVFDFAGNLLLKLDGVGQTLEDSGPYIYNRGQNLIVRRLRIYQKPIGTAQQQIDLTQPRVYMMDGRVVHGKLFVKKEKAYVLAENGTQHDIGIGDLDRVVQPSTTLTEIEHPVALTYPDGAVIRGKIAQVNSEHILLKTAFAAEPIACALSGASLLRMELAGSESDSEIENADRLFHASGNLRGRVLVAEKDGAFIHWQPVGASEAIRLANTGTTRIERNSRRASKAWPLNASQYRHTLHLKNGEIIPCQLLSYTETNVSFNAPFIKTQRIDTVHVKALEFSGRTQANYINSDRSISSRSPYIVLGQNGGHNNIRINKIDWQENAPKDQEAVVFNIEGLEMRNGMMIILKDGKEIEVDPEGDLTELLFHHGDSKNHKLDVKLERALTVPRFKRDTPPNHILVGRNGDMRRGKLLGYNGDVIQFASKLKRFSVPIDRVARVVAVNVEHNGGSAVNPAAQAPNVRKSEICVRLTDGTLLVFEPIAVKADKLFGHSSVYGDITVPVESIQQFYFGDRTESFTTAFAAWVLRSAQEPKFGPAP